MSAPRPPPLGGWPVLPERTLEWGGVGSCGGSWDRGQGEARTEPPASRAALQAAGTRGVPRSSGGPLSAGSLFPGDPVSFPVQSGPRVACTVCFSTVWKLKFTSTCFWASKGASGAPCPLLHSSS